MRSREISVVNGMKHHSISTTNRTIIDYAVDYVNKKDLGKEIISPINHIRTYKRMFLPCELLGMSGDFWTIEYSQIDKKSCLMWKFEFKKVPKLSRKSKEIWKDFLE